MDTARNGRYFILSEVVYDKGLQTTIRTWKRAKPRILAAYYAQGSEKSAKTMQAKVMQSAYGVEHEQSECENTFMDRNEERALKKENEYLKAKNAYLESLLESLGYEPGKLKKKGNTRQFQEQEKKE